MKLVAPTRKFNSVGAKHSPFISRRKEQKGKGERSRRKDHEGRSRKEKEGEERLSLIHN